MAKGKTEAAQKKTKCPVSREEFTENVKPLGIKVGEQVVAAAAKEFSSGSYGWFASDKVTVMVGEVPCKAQVTVNITLVGSKPSDE